MPLTTAGAQFIANAITNNGSPTFFDDTNSYIAVGSGATAFNIAQTTLVTEVTATDGRKLVDSAPGVSGGDITMIATYDTASANDTWAEWGIFNDPTADTGVMLSRKVEALGTKTSAQSWQITVTLSVTA